MAKLFPSLETIRRLTVAPTEGESHLIDVLFGELGDEYEIYFNPYLDGDRPDIIILRPDYGVAVIEVKDWHPMHYHIDINNQWFYRNNRLRSPQQQAFRYKDNLFNLHLPLLGLQELRNKNFYGVISVHVYFHNASREQIDHIYSPALAEVKETIQRLNQNRTKIGQSDYDRQMDYWERKRRQLNRDQGMIWCHDTLYRKIREIKRRPKNLLFSDDIYQDFQRRLAPPVHTERQGIRPDFDDRQRPLIESHPGLLKIKGVAGCGKTTILAQRAINAHYRHHGQVLILTYNITLRNFIRDTISGLLGRGAGNQFEIIHYHGFINAKINDYGLDVQALSERLPAASRNDPYAIYQLVDLFKDVVTEQFSTILIDEIQDYHPEWIKIIRDNFLAEQGEMVLFGDQSQNIYDRELSKRESVIVQGFGRWQKLTKSYRSSPDAPLLQLFNRFQGQFLLNKYKDSERFDTNQGSMNFDILAYEPHGAPYDPELVLARIQNYVRSYGLIPNDTVIISSKVEFLFPINEAIKRGGERTKVMFEEEEELKSLRKFEKEDPEHYRSEVERIRRRKKTFFMLNSGLIKLSTTHSFKGLEAQTVFCILTPDDTAEMVYTGITRAQKNLVVFDAPGSSFSDFFLRHMSTDTTAAHTSCAQ